MTKEELLPSCVEYFHGDRLAAEVFLDKYAMRTKNNDILERTPADMHRRLAKEFARIEQKYPNPISEDTIFNLLDHFKYIVPQGSPMAGIGNNHLFTSLSNCFVIGDKRADSYGGIMRTDEEQTQIMKRRGGVGHDLSHLRPAGAMANNSALNDMAGAVSYAQRYSNSTKEVRQGDRRGALMLSMSIKHPDAERFIDAKLESGKVTDANISVKITDYFMYCVVNDLDFRQTFPIDMTSEECVGEFPGPIEDWPYDALVTGISGDCYAKRVNAKRLWNKIIHNAWKSAEPGVLFWDRIIAESPADSYEDYQTISTNPCGEIPLCADDSCRLLLVNLYSYVIDPFTPNARFNMEKFINDVIIAQRMMDDIVDLEIEKIERIMTKIKLDPESLSLKNVELQLWNRILIKAYKGRRTGLGITGEGDMLAALGLTYGTPNATAHSVEVHKQLATYSYISSIIMAEERGAFTDWNYEKEKKNPFLVRVKDQVSHVLLKYELMWESTGHRNISNLTISPAGSVSIETQTTSGIEPVFLVSYKRRRRTLDKNKITFTDDHGETFEDYHVFHRPFIKWFEVNYWDKAKQSNDWSDFYKGDLTPLTAQEWLESCHDSIIEKYIKESPYHNATSADVNWEAKVDMQGQIQRWIDHSISATTNVPANTSEEIVDLIYRTAYQSGCKGMTIYREGSRSGILVSNKAEQFQYVDAIKRTKEMECDIYHKMVLGQRWMILVGKLEGKPYEIFNLSEVPNHLFPTKIEKGKIIKVKSHVFKLIGQDSDGKSYDIPNIIDLIGNSDQVSTRKFSLMLRHRIDPKWIVQDIEAYALVTSFDKAIQRVLKNYIIEDGEKCSECGGELMHKDGCVTCSSCGWSKCG